MSLNDKILEILKKKPMLGTAEVQDELKNLGEEKNLRTIQRHILKLVKEHKVNTAVYDRKKRRPLYAVMGEETGEAEYQSLIDDPRIDWNKIPNEDRPRLVYVAKCFGSHSLEFEAYYLLLKRDDTKSFKEKVKELFASRKK